MPFPFRWSWLSKFPFLFNIYELLWLLGKNIEVVSFCLHCAFKFRIVFLLNWLPSKATESSLSYDLDIIGKRTDGFMLSLKAFMQKGMQNKQKFEFNLPITFCTDGHYIYLYIFINVYELLKFLHSHSNFVILDNVLGISYISLILNKFYFC